MELGHFQEKLAFIVAEHKGSGPTNNLGGLAFLQQLLRKLKALISTSSSADESSNSLVVDADGDWVLSEEPGPSLAMHERPRPPPPPPPPFFALGAELRLPVKTGGYKISKDHGGSWAYYCSHGVRKQYGQCGHCSLLGSNDVNDEMTNELFASEWAQKHREVSAAQERAKVHVREQEQALAVERERENSRGPWETVDRAAEPTALAAVATPISTVAAPPTAPAASHLPSPSPLPPAVGFSEQIFEILDQVGKVIELAQYST